MASVNGAVLAANLAKKKAENTNSYSAAAPAQATAAPAQAPAAQAPAVGTTATSIPNTYTPTDYSSVANQAAQQANAQGLGSITDLAGVNERINQAANLMNTPTFQDSDYLSKATQNIMQTMNPVLRQQNALTGQQYDNSGRALKESLALSGLNRGGTSANKMMFLEQARNNQMSTNQANMMDKAMQQAVQQGQMALTERGQLQQQAQSAAAQLANLLGMQESSNQWATTTNLNTEQNNFANMLASLKAQSEEGQFGATYGQQAAQIAQALKIAQMQDLTQRYSSDNSLAGTKYASDNSLAGSKYSADAGVKSAGISAGASTANAKLAAQTAANALAAQITQQNAQNALQAGQLTGTYNGVETLGAKQLASDLAQQELANNLAVAGLTGSYNGQDTMAAQQLAQQIKQNELANALATAGVTGMYGGQQTLQAQQLAAQNAYNNAQLTGQYNGQDTIQAQQLAAQLAQNEIQNQLARDQLNAGNTNTYNALMASLLGNYFANAEDIALPKFAVDYLEDLQPPGY